MMIYISYFHMLYFIYLAKGEGSPSAQMLIFKGFSYKIELSTKLK